MSKHDEEFTPEELADRTNEFYDKLNKETINRKDRVTITVEVIKSGQLFPVETPDPMMMNSDSGDNKPGESKPKPKTGTP